MKIIPTLNIMEKPSEYETVIKRFVETNTDSYLRCCVTKRENKDFIDCINTMQNIHRKLTGSNFKLMIDISAPKDKIRIVFSDGAKQKEVNAGDKVFLTNKLNFNEYEDGVVIFVNYDLTLITSKDVIIGNGDLLLQEVIRSDDAIIYNCLNNSIIKSSQAISASCGFIQKSDVAIEGKCLDLVKELKPECVALSYIENREDLLNIKSKIKNVCGYMPELMAKIETVRGCENINEIICEADSIMIARGCLGLNAGSELLFYQDLILNTCKEKKKEIYIASNIMRSLKSSVWPMRSEFCDAAYILKSGYKNLIITDKYCVTENFKFLVRFLKDLDNIYK